MKEAAATAAQQGYPHKRRAVIVAGVRTPFCKSFGELIEVCLDRLVQQSRKCFTKILISKMQLRLDARL